MLGLENSFDSFADMDVMHQIVMGTTRVAVGHHHGVHQYLDENLTDEEREIIEPLSPRKRTEWLASRELLFQISKLPKRAECIYDEFGKPELKGSNRHISISHSELWCAAMISDHKCGVDVQIYSPTVKRIAERFLTNQDVVKAEKKKNPIHYLHVLWGAKECMYKAYGRRKLGFRENILITELDETKDTGRGEISFEGLHLQYEFYYRLLPEMALVFCLEHGI